MFTINNPSEATYSVFDNWTSELPSYVRYFIVQSERGEAGTLHLQGYCELLNAKTVRCMQTHFKAKAHIERRRGSAQDAAGYCRKEDRNLLESDADKRWEGGTISRQGQRDDKLANLVVDLNEGVPLNDLEDDYPKQFLLHGSKIIDRYIELKGRRHLKPDQNNVLIYVGPSGSGKSTTAWTEYPDAYKGCWPTGGRWWWPNYKGEEVVIFDEFRQNISYQQALALFDIHPMDIEYKGGNTNMVSRKIIITTIQDPKYWYQNVEDKTELERRIRQNATIFDFSEEGSYPNFIKDKRMREFRFKKLHFGPGPCEL